MKLPPFEYLEPATVPEALAILDTYRDRVAIIAGGTELINRLRLRLSSPDYVMNIKKLRDLEGIGEQEQAIAIGANVTIKEISASSLFRKKYQAIAEAASQVAAPPLAQRRPGLRLTDGGAGKGAGEQGQHPSFDHQGVADFQMADVG
jgi:carbon-monoxide dehydrogenase medium subunit